MGWVDTEKVLLRTVLGGMAIRSKDSERTFLMDIDHWLASSLGGNLRWGIVGTTKPYIVQQEPEADISITATLRSEEIWENPGPSTILRNAVFFPWFTFMIMHVRGVLGRSEVRRIGTHHDFVYVQMLKSYGSCVSSSSVNTQL